MSRPTIRIRPVIFLLLVAAIGLAWYGYNHASNLTDQLPRHLGDLYPLYLRDLPIDWNRDPDLLRRLAWAIGVAIVGTGAVLAALVLRARLSLCLLVATVAVVLISGTHAHLRAGRASFVKPFDVPRIEYFDDIPRVGDDPLGFVANYPRISPTLSHHAGTHPPGGILFLWAGAKLFDPSIDTAAWWATIIGALGLLPACLIARIVGGARAARRLLPLYVAAPTIVLFTAVCMDTVFMVFQLLALAAGLAANRRGSWWLIALAGAALWLAAFLSFSAVAVPVLLILDALLRFTLGGRIGLRSCFRTAMTGVVFLLCSLLAYQFLGYDLIGTVHAAAERDHSSFGLTGFDSLAVWYQLSLANVLAVVLGSGVMLAGLWLMSVATSLRHTGPIDRFTWAVTLALILLSISTLFTLETERVLILFTPLLAISATRHFKGATIWLLVPPGLLVQAFALEFFYNTRW